LDAEFLRPVSASPRDVYNFKKNTGTIRDRLLIIFSFFLNGIVQLIHGYRLFRERPVKFHQGV
ncbi:MAG: hypothetical protein AB1442_17710, partial [Nitrospirota bacterium]